MPTIKENLDIWDLKYDWSKNGDEWTGQAKICNIPYEEWRGSIAKYFIYPNINKHSTVLEIGPGHGRWTAYILKNAKKAILVDLSPNCISFCKKRFTDFNNITYFVNNGKDLSFIKSESIDFIWSYDVFVHIEPNAIADYFSEFRRILKKDGKAIIHHANRKHWSLPLLPSLFKFRLLGRIPAAMISMNKVWDGWRSQVSKELISSLALKANLLVQKQTNTWGENNKYKVPRFNDYISILINKK